MLKAFLNDPPQLKSFQQSAISFQPLQLLRC